MSSRPGRPSTDGHGRAAVAGHAVASGPAALLTTEGAHLLASLPPYGETDPMTLSTRLRRGHDPDLVAAALTQSRLRARALAKFSPDDAARMLFTPDGLEQSTRARVAAHRATRFAARGLGRVADLCCGIGGDLVALARTGADVLGVERDSVTAALAEANAGALGLADRVRVRVGDVRTVDVSGCQAAFCDPSRRDGRGRVFDPDAYDPPLGDVLDLAGRTPLAVKVAPGVGHERVPADAEAEWVSDAGEVKEAVLWFGPLRSDARRRATLLPSRASLVADPSAGPPPVGSVGRYLYEPDGAVVRAHLVGEVAAAVSGRLLDPTVAYVTADTHVPTAFATAYEVVDVLPFGLKRLRAHLRARDVGSVTIKKRGSAVEPEHLRRQLRLGGRRAVTLVLTRVAGAQTVLVCRADPLRSPGPGPHPA